MKRALLFCLLWASPVFAQAHADVVASVKATLTAQHVDLSGPCGAFAITSRVAWRLKGEGAGLLIKPAGNNCQGYAVDEIAYPDGRLFDILVDSGGANGPSWNPNGIIEISRYHPAFDPGDTGPIVSPPSTPPPTPVDLSPILRRLDVLEQQVKDQSGELHAQRDVLNNFDQHFQVMETRLQVLETKPIPVSCRASANLGFARIPVSCTLQ